MMKFKLNMFKVLTILVLTSFATPIFSENLFLNPSKSTSWQPYIGGNLGYGRMSARNNWSETTSEPTAVFTIAGKNNFNNKGLVGRLFVGIQKFVTPTTKLGFELYGFLGSEKASVASSIGDVLRGESLKKENGGGIKTKAGYLFDTHSAVYAHLGVEKAAFKYSVSSGGEVPKSRKYLWGMPFGIGVETSLGPVWSIRIEYTHTVYQKWNTGTQPISATTISKAKISPSQDSILVGVSYAF